MGCFYGSGISDAKVWYVFFYDFLKGGDNSLGLAAIVVWDCEW